MSFKCSNVGYRRMVVPSMGTGLIPVGPWQRVCVLMSTHMWKENFWFLSVIWPAIPN